MPVVGGSILAISLSLKPQGAYLCVPSSCLQPHPRYPALAAYVSFTAAAAAGRHPAVLFPPLLVFAIPSGISRRI